MTREEIAEKVMEVVREQMAVEADRVKTDTHIANDLGADSLDAVEIIMEIEDQFNIIIPDEAIQGAETVSKVVDYVVKAVGAQTRSES
jgi:acyl carrier protein